MLSVLGRRLCMFSVSCVLAGGLTACSQEQLRRFQAQATGTPIESTTPVELTWNVPSLSLLPLAPAEQTVGDVGAGITLPQYSQETHRKVETFDAPQTGVVGPSAGSGIKYLIDRSTPFAVVDPADLQFGLTLFNRMVHSLKLGSTAITLTVDGKPVAVTVKGVPDWRNAEVPAGGRLDVTVVGPPITELPAHGSVTLVLENVVVALDDAGQAAERANIQWFLSCDVRMAAGTDVVRSKEYRVKLECSTCHRTGACTSCTGTGWLGGMKATNTRCTECRGTGQCTACGGRGW